MKLSDLINKHKGKGIIICGGSPQLKEDYLKYNKGRVVIGCNEHLYKLGVTPDYLCINNDPDIYPNLMDVWKEPKGAKIISKIQKYSDYEIDLQVVDRGFTAHMAAWIATEMTDKEVILCGINCYSTEKFYSDDRKHERFERLVRRDLGLSLLEGWEKWKKQIHNPERVFANEWPLTEIFNKYEK